MNVDTQYTGTEPLDAPRIPQDPNAERWRVLNNFWLKLPGNWWREKIEKHYEGMRDATTEATKVELAQEGPLRMYADIDTAINNAGLTDAVCKAMTDAETLTATNRMAAVYALYERLEKAGVLKELRTKYTDEQLNA